MRITIGTTQYRWTPGCRTINIWTDTPYIGEGKVWTRWLETDVISFGYDKPDNSTTQLEMLDVLIHHLVDAAIDRHPAGRDTVSQDEPRCPACGDYMDYCQGHGMTGDPDGFRILTLHDYEDHSECNPAGCDAHVCRPGMYSDAICGACKAPLT